MADTETEVRDNAGFLIWRLSMRWRAAMDQVLAPLGLTQAQYAVLAPLGSLARGGARPSQRELADLTGLERGLHLQAGPGAGAGGLRHPVHPPGGSARG